MFDVIVYFTDNSHIIIPNVSTYSWEAVDGAVAVKVDGRWLFFNKSNVKYVGQADKMGKLVKTVAK